MIRQTQTQTMRREHLLAKGELIYRGEIDRLLGTSQEVIQRWIFENSEAVTTDAISGRDFQQLARSLRRIFEEPQGMRGVFRRLSEFMLQDTRDVVAATVPGVTVEDLSEGLQDLQIAWVGTNTDLIKRMGPEVERVILAKLRDRGGGTEEQLYQALQSAIGVSESKAEFWAVDQMLSLHADLTEHRHKAVGVLRYSWTDSGDERTRHRHAELGDMSDRGVTFTYANPPVVDLATGRRRNPGKDFRCRCTGYPVLD